MFGHQINPKKKGTMLALLGSVALSVSQFAIPCNYPSQFTCKATRFNFAGASQDRMQITFDGQNRRMFESDTVTSNIPGARFYERIILYEENTMYTVRKGSGEPTECTKSEIPQGRSFRPLGVPENSTFVQQLEIGSYDDGFLANEFQLLKQQAGRLPGVSYNFHTTVTAHSCVPIQEYLYHTNSSGHIINELSMFTQYSNFVKGVTNPSIFIPPRICTDPPKPPPSPPAPPPSPSCNSALASFCGADRTPSKKCIECATAHQTALTKDGCSYTDIDKFCVPSDRWL